MPARSRKRGGRYRGAHTDGVMQRVSTWCHAVVSALCARAVQVCPGAWRRVSRRRGGGCGDSCAPKKELSEMAALREDSALPPCMIAKPGRTDQMVQSISFPLSCSCSSLGAREEVALEPRLGARVCCLPLYLWCGIRIEGPINTCQSPVLGLGSTLVPRAPKCFGLVLPACRYPS